jgi:hypothetical protein
MQIVDQYGLVRPRQSRGTVFANRFHRRAYNRLERIGLNAREADEEFALLEHHVREWRRRCLEVGPDAPSDAPAPRTYTTDVDLFYNTACTVVYWVIA